MVAFQENITGNGLFRKNSKNLQKISGDGRFFFHHRVLQTKNVLNYFADENYLRDQNLRGHFEETVTYHIEKSVGRYRSFRTDSYILFQKDSLLSHFMGSSIINL